MNRCQHVSRIVFVLLGLVSSECAYSGDIAATPVEFNRDIRPILSENCFFCHGPDEENREAELRFDTAEDALADRGDYFAILPGKPDESELWNRITSEDPDELMPPPESHKHLTEQEKQLLRSWIKEGAVWQGHWAFIAPNRPEVPEQKALVPEKKRENANPIDLFVSQQLTVEGLSPAPEADRRTLARRLSFDLTGLPAKYDEVEAFINSSDPHAYENLIDRLLASPHYGERMTQFWLDLVRYADTNGIHGDNPRSHSPYRDYVIRAFNENMPFDQFTREQLAGDLLPEASNQQKIASGYNRLNMTTREGGSQPKEFMAKYSADRVRNAASVWLGITMGCCECHDHKFDPYTAREFYEFAAFFADLQETPVGVQQSTFLAVGKNAEKLTHLQQQLQAAEAKLNEQTTALDATQADWESSLHLDKSEWVLLRPQEATAEQGVVKIREDGSLLTNSHVNNPATNTYLIKAKINLPAITAIRIDVLPDPSLPHGGPGRAGNGNFVLNDFSLQSDSQKFSLSNPSATYSQEGWNVAGAIDNDPATGWAILDHGKPRNNAVFYVSAQSSEPEETLLTVSLVQNHGTSHTLGHFRLFVTSSPDPMDASKVTNLPHPVADSLRFDRASRTDAQQEIVSAYFRSITPLLSAFREQATVLRQQIDSVNQESAVLAAVSIEPREMRVLPKGDWLNETGDIVTPGVPACFPELGVSDRRATRVDLANWMVRDDQPLVARVLVNRLWRLMFGRGIVASSDDFGAQGDWPSHPKLLDWLATELVENDWNIKHIMRLIASSNTYRQSSSANDELLDRDPGNQWLARQGRFRLDAEIVRDNMLAVSGLLSLEVGGKSVKPYQPTGYWQHLNFPRRTYEHDSGENLYRRGLYTHWQRTFLHPSLLAFDAPTREECTAKRSRSNTPLQALVLLNDPTYVEAARAFAERMIRQHSENPSQTLQYAYQQLFARTATQAEVSTLLDFYQEQKQQYEADKPAAAKLIEIGERPVPEDADQVDLAAWTSVARVLLNLHETITRY